MKLGAWTQSAQNVIRMLETVNRLQVPPSAAHGGCTAKVPLICVAESITPVNVMASCSVRVLLFEIVAELPSAPTEH